MTLKGQLKEFDASRNRPPEVMKKYRLWFMVPEEVVAAIRSIVGGP